MTTHDQIVWLQRVKQRTTELRTELDRGVEGFVVGYARGRVDIASVLLGKAMEEIDGALRERVDS